MARACLTFLALVAALPGCGGSAPPKSPSRTTTCYQVLDHVEALAGDIDRGLTAGPISGFDSLTSRRLWLDACTRFSPWVRRCLVLSTVRQELSSCAPSNEPWSRHSDLADVPPEDKAEFLACVDHADDRLALSRCGYPL